MMHIRILAFLGLFAATSAGAAPNASIGLCDGAATIATSADWSKLNTSGSKVFCVQPGSYSATLTVTADGIAGNPKILRFVGSSDAYKPWAETSNRASFTGQLVFKNAHNWVVDGIRFTRSGSGNVIKIEGPASNITLQNVLIEGGGGGTGHLHFRIGVSNLTLQNSVLRNTIQGTGDQHCIKLVGLSTNTKILDNEIYNCAGDGIQVGNATTDGSIDINEGVTIQGNDMYITPEMYTNGSGVKIPTGAYACAENAIDIKGVTRASDPVPEAKWMKILGNRMWGFRKPDTTCGGTPSSYTQSVVFHNASADNIMFRDNVIFDAGGGLGIPQKNDGGTGYLDHISVINNLFYDIKSFAFTAGSNGVGLYFKQAHKVETYFNTIMQVGRQSVFRKSGEAFGNDYRCNLFINAKDDSGTDNSPSTHNAYYNTGRMNGDTSSASLVRSTAAEAAMVDYTFTIKRRTAPTTKTIPGAKTTPTSPHANLCSGVTIGTVLDVGVDNATYSGSAAGAVLP